MAILKVAPEVVARAIGATDWQAVDAQTDEEISVNVAVASNAAPILTGGETAAAIARTVRKRPGLSRAEFGAPFRIVP